eukprot:scaffold66569_cov56-Phaeocystis_antarctica.AAC.1
MVKGRTLRQAALEGATPFPSSSARSSPPKGRASGSRSRWAARARTPCLLWALPPKASPLPSRPLRTACGDRMVRRCSARWGGMPRASGAAVPRHAQRVGQAEAGRRARAYRLCRGRRRRGLSTGSRPWMPPLGVVRGRLCAESRRWRTKQGRKDSCVLSSAASAIVFVGETTCRSPAARLPPGSLAARAALPI